MFGRIQWHVIPEPPAKLQGAATWRIQCHDSRATCHIGGCWCRANSMTCHPRATYHIAGCCHLVNSLSRLQSHMPDCTVQSPGEINVTFSAQDAGREGNRSARWIREWIEIRKQDIQGHTMNRDAGTYTLSHLYDALFSATATSCGANRNQKSFRQRQQMLPKRQQRNRKVWSRFNYINNVWQSTDKFIQKSDEICKYLSCLSLTLCYCMRCVRSLFRFVLIKLWHCGHLARECNPKTRVTRLFLNP